MNTTHNHLDFNRRPLTKPTPAYLHESLNKRKLTKRGERVQTIARWGAGLAATGLAFGAMGAVIGRTNGYSDDEMRNMKKVTYTVQPGESPIAILRAHESAVLGDQGNAVSIEQFITSQGTAHDKQGSPILNAGQHIEIPVPDGVSFTTDAPQLFKIA